MSGLGRPSLDPTVFVAEGVRLSGDLRIEAEANLWYNVVIRADLAPVRIGRGSNIQDGSLLHVDHGFPLIVGEYVTVGHGCILHGATIGDLCLIGMGSIVMNGSRLGEGALLGAGSLVTEGQEIPPRTLALGRPARVVRELTPEETERHREWAEEYIRLAFRHQPAERG